MGLLFYQIWHTRHSTLDRLQELLADAEANRDKETRAAINIQRLFRGQFVRTIIAIKRSAEIVLARVYRGHLARKRCHKLKMKRIVHEKRQVFTYHATYIQKMYRGFRSRKYIMDFRIRKAYVKQLVAKGEELRLAMEQRLKEQQMEESKRTEIDAQCELKEVTSNLHHLVSTKSIAGIYNSPMVSTMSSSFGIPIEEHIRTNTKHLLTKQLVQQKPPTKMLPYPPSNKATLQASSPYDADLKAVRLQKKMHKILRISDQEFMSHTHSMDPVYTPGINTGMEYVDEWKNPYKKRGIPLTKEDLLPNVSTLDKPPKQKDAFYLSFGGNKSKIHANDRFDV